LKSKADKTKKADTRQGYDDEIEALNAKQASMQAKLQELKKSNGGAWGISRKGWIMLGMK
jgi:hypothetical protein